MFYKELYQIFESRQFFLAHIRTMEIKLFNKMIDKKANNLTIFFGQKFDWLLRDQG
jgi:hypothetical protein